MNNYEIENDLRNTLSPGERFEWTGRPKRGIVFRTSDIFSITFSLLWFALIIFLQIGFITAEETPFFKLWKIPICIFVLYSVAGRFFVSALKRANTLYGITQDRIIIKSGIFNPEIKSFNINTLSNIAFNQRADNTGTITFGTAESTESIIKGTEWNGNKQTPRLEIIEDVKAVYDQIISLQIKSSKERKLN